MLNPPHLPHRGAPISYITSLEEFVLIQELIDEILKKSLSVDLHYQCAMS